MRHAAIITDKPEKRINNVYSPKEAVTKSKTQIEFEDGEKIVVKKNPQAIKGMQLDKVIVEKQISEEAFETIIKTRVKGKKGVVIDER